MRVEIGMTPYLNVDGRFWRTLAVVQLGEFSTSWMEDSMDWDYESDETDPEILFSALVQIEHEEKGVSGI